MCCLQCTQYVRFAEQVAVFRAEVVLSIPSINVRPSLDEMQTAVSRVVQKCVLALGTPAPAPGH